MGISGADKDTLDHVLGELASLREENRRLAVEVAELKASQEQKAQVPSQQQNGDHGDPPGGLSRRHLLQALGGAAVGGAGLVAGGALGAKPAAANNGDSLVLGSQTNSASSPTGLEVTGTGSAYGIGVTDNGLNTYPDSVDHAAVFGHSHDQNFAAGVAGYADAGGNAVEGLSRQDPTTLDQGTGVRGQGNPGVNGVGENGGAGIEGFSLGAAGPGVNGEGAPGVHGTPLSTTGVGVQGTTRGYVTVPASGTGVLAEAIDTGQGPPTSTSVGLLATNAGNGVAVKASSTSGRGIVVAGHLAQLQLTPGSGAHPASGATGDLFEDSTGILWLCVGGTSWRKLGGLKTAGQLHILPSPVRVYDSRKTGGPLAGGTERTVSLTTGTNGTTPAVPVGAIASLFTLTIVNTGTNGFLAAFSNAVSWPGTSNINWFQVGTVEATSVTSAVDPSAKIKLHCGGTPTDFVIDVTGYYE